MHMESQPRSTLHEARFRASRAYEFVPFEHLSRDQQTALAGLRDDPDCYGVLVPRPGSGRTIKTLCRDSALLFRTLREPGPLPPHIQRAVGSSLDQDIARLVMDGVLEIEATEDFAWGAGAYDLLFEGPPAYGTGHIAALSLAALRYAQALDINDPMVLSLRMYLYNREPLTATWRRALPDAAAVAAFLGIQAGGPCDPLLSRHWTSRPNQATDGWYAWHARRSRAGRRGGSFKLYVSPQAEAIPHVLRTAIEIFSVLEVPSFKIGGTSSGLLRPDKLVAYFDSFEALTFVGERLADALQGVPVQGVPFTAELAGDGLLSWGTDPDEGGTVAWLPRESWRLWVTNRLATALLTARTATSSVEPWQFALQRLRLEGVDTLTWAPPGTHDLYTPVLGGARNGYH
jgi:hypothetical protein